MFLLQKRFFLQLKARCVRRLREIASKERVQETNDWNAGRRRLTFQIYFEISTWRVLCILKAEIISRFPVDQTISDKRTLKIRTKPDTAAPFPFQNRTKFDEKRTSLLKESIKQHDEKL